MRRKWIYIVPLAILGIVVFTFLGGHIVRLLWNWLLPPLFGLPALTFWQALGMLALCRILFGGLGRHGGGRSRYTPEERERFRHAVRARWGMSPSTSEGGESKGQ